MLRALWGSGVDDAPAHKECYVVIEAELEPLRLHLQTAPDFKSSISTV